jgi:hypothetical protein
MDRQDCLLIAGDRQDCLSSKRVRAVGAEIRQHLPEEIAIDEHQRFLRRRCEAQLEPFPCIRERRAELGDDALQRLGTEQRLPDRGACEP